MSLSPFAHDHGSGNLPVGDADDRTDRSPRTNLFLSALLAVPGKRAREVRVRNLSASGARIDCADPPPRTTLVSLCRGSAKAAAEVVWADRTSCGLRFVEPIEVARWMPDRPGAALATRAEEPSLAEDLVLARQLVERLEGVLTDQELVVGMMGTELQALDLLVQLLRTSERRAGGSPAPTARSVRKAAATFLQQPPGAGFSG